MRTLRSMGWVKNLKADVIAGEARKAAERGQTVFAAMLNTPMTMPDLSGEVPGWGDMVAAVEAQGWRLEHWSAGADHKGRPQAYPVFRRVP